MAAIFAKGNPKTPTLLVTGHSGFVGQALFRSPAVTAEQFHWRLAKLPDNLDIRDSTLAAAVKEISPDAILHLAAQTSVAESFRDPDTCFQINFSGTLNLLRALRAADFRGRMRYVSSGDCYGSVAESALPVNEQTPLRARNPYAVSKVAAETLCYQWSQTERIDVVIARPFNHIGPGQDTRFAIPAFCEQISRIKLMGAEPVIHVGNLDVTRDFTDVRDVLRAYFALLAQGKTGEAYNIASGHEVRLGDVLSTLVDLAGVELAVIPDPSRQRAVEQRRMVADITKVQRDTGWAPRIPLRETLTVTLDDWNRRMQ
jgi:GDP-4-dehydro-6-deoxy-D-mannose reductase